MSCTHLLRVLQVTERRGRCRSQLYDDIKHGLMTPGIRVSPQVSVWPDHEVEAITRAEIAGATVEERKALVQQLIAMRAQMRPALPP